MFIPEEKNPGRLKKWVQKPLRMFLTYKLPLFLVALFVPEYILAWAIRQYLKAGIIQEKYRHVPGWTRTHGFFVIMGGFHLFSLPKPSSWAIPSKPGKDSALVLSSLDTREDEKPRCPLGIEDIPPDILRAITPTESELKDKGKSDAITKAIVIVQTSWFVIQCIARGVRQLPLTELEVVTLAYAMMNFFIYVFWWDKPRDVACPIRVYDTTGIREQAAEKAGWYWTFAYYILGRQDDIVNLYEQQNVPMFWSAMKDSYGNMETKAYLGPSLLGMGFGAIHCIAWSAVFPSHTELLFWHISCITLMVVPLVATLLCTSIIADSAAWEGSNPSGTLLQYAGYALLGLLGLSSWLYIAARAATIIIAFTTLRSLPSAAYTVVDWTTFIPHI